MSGWINQLSSIGHLLEDSNEERIKKSFLVFLAIFMSGGGILWGSISIFNGLIFQSIIPYGYVVISIINLIYFRYSKNFKVVRFIQVFISLVLPFLFQWSLGGFFPSGLIMLWAILALIASLSFVEIKTAYVWLGLFIAGTLLSAYFDEYFFNMKPGILKDQSLLFVVLNVTVICSIVFGLVHYYVVRNKAVRAELERTSNEMKRLNRKLAENLKEKREALKELRKTQSQLVEAEKMASLGVLSAGVGHEINNPLNFIRGGVTGLTHHLTKYEEHDDSIESYLELINKGVDRATGIVRSLSHFSRTGTNMNERCDIHEIIDNCLVILQNKLKNRIEVIKDFTGESTKRLGNDGRLHQVFLNILSNAEQAITDTGIITIQTSVNNEQILVNISDTGYGIDDKTISRIMDPFFTTKPPGEGTGLGLSIAYTIIEEHGGKIKVSSEIGKGTIFELMLPVVTEEVKQ